MVKLNKISILRIIAFIFIITVFVIWYFGQKKDLNRIETFESCVMAGYPILDDPNFFFRKCKISDDKIFQEEVSVRLKNERAVIIYEPIEGQKANGKIKIRGVIKNARFMSNITVAAWQSDGEYAGYSKGNISIPISEEGGFEGDLELPFGPGRYRIDIYVPSIQERKPSSDDETLYLVDKFYVINMTNIQ